MLVSEIATSVKRQFGDETGAQITDADVIRWVNEGQLEIMRRTESALTATSLAVSASQDGSDLPADFFKVSSVYLADYGNLMLLTESQRNIMFPSLAEEARSTPKYYSVRTHGSAVAHLYLHPMPDVACTIEVVYVARPVLVTATSDSISISNAFYETLINYCLAKAKQLDGDMESFAALSGVFRNQLGDNMHDARHIDESTYPFIRANPEDRY